MFDLLLFRRRLLLTADRVSFKAKNKDSIMFGSFSVNYKEDNKFFIYYFNNIKIIVDKKNVKHIILFHNNVRQIEINRFFYTKLFNDRNFVNILFERIDDYTNNYTNLRD